MSSIGEVIQFINLFKNKLNLNIQIHLCFAWAPSHVETVNNGLATEAVKVAVPQGHTELDLLLGNIRVGIREG